MNFKALLLSIISVPFIIAPNNDPDETAEAIRICEERIKNGQEVVQGFSTFGAIGAIGLLESYFGKEENTSFTIKSASGATVAAVIIGVIAQCSLQDDFLRIVTKLKNNEPLDEQEIKNFQRMVTIKSWIINLASLATISSTVILLYSRIYPILKEQRAYWFPTTEEKDLAEKSLLKSRVNLAVLSAESSLTDCLIKCKGDTPLNSEGFPCACEYAADALKAIGKQDFLSRLTNIWRKCNIIGKK